MSAPDMNKDLIALRIRLLVDMLDDDLRHMPESARTGVSATRASIVRLAEEVARGEFL